jgi:hypothetical protein
VDATTNCVGVTNGSIIPTVFSFVPIRPVRFRSGTASFGVGGARTGGQHDLG